MSARYPIPAAETRVETRVLNSRFICTVAEARTVAEALAFIRRVKTELSDANSHAYAYRIGFGASVMDGCNDGGEPGGTAGRPMLAVLQGSGLGDVVAVVSRYFGGTKLGTGGLVRAFGGALQAALDALPRAERVERRQCLLEVPYPLYERVKRLIAARDDVLPEDETFGACVLLTMSVAEESIADLRRALSDLSAGALTLVIAA
ncbi:MAG: DUF1949 domain-containing protein [Chloroflexi bacterium]|jgi:uncharacterized YigZ family protein|uniref:YigZ family protein n=1 Tax=Candidatus Thermofonsia Clade 3 bacterium TaxID=2364212 RepID=A0A2M8QFS2_9CHLR|nr:YigZ family protein [Candidatus Roseilinea sp. NK_OTU-006]PJF48657.1 MAG: YigZ family protein [Candidatus Thermofonsia Clade 3 bacterium]RMG63281.1 MAG: DUF1949 domain-containing protein [Chloroflexota bacterium]